ncbi:MAG: c-type cytochrome [Gammaproteobacteria bacterium]|nr:c-type cytochrome [Gammaproteobacteria bacterium]MBI5617393.1 c-type cytochrome [Gammaproteobacteria bacterium]
MSYPGNRWLLASISAAALVFGIVATAQAVDEEAARALAKQSSCFKCHSVEKKKEGPPWNTISEKHKDMAPADLEAKLTHHITSGEKVKFEDGHEEEHKIIKSDDPAAIKNLVQWIMSLKAK